MKIMLLGIHFYFILLIFTNIKISHSSLHKNNIFNNNKKEDQLLNIYIDTQKRLNIYNESQLFKKRKLQNTVCNIKNCLLCENRNQCIKCKDNYELVDYRCYSKNCEIFGFCRYCDDYDCLKCIKGYKLNYGICDIKVRSKKLMILKICIAIFILFLLIYLYLYLKKRSKEKIETGQVIKFLHPKAGYYKLNFEKSNNNEEIQDSQDKSLSSSNSDSGIETKSPEVKCCVVCGSKKTYTIADCGCSLCLEDYKIIKGEKERIQCRVHKIFLSSNISFEMYYKSHIKGNAVEKLGLPKCPICKINDGTQSFNCGCPMRVCEKCFNDNVYVLKYSQCPGCGKHYIPLKSIKKRKKSQEEKVNK